MIIKLVELVRRIFWAIFLGFIGKSSVIEGGVIIRNPKMISIGNNTIIAAQTSLIPIGPIVIGSHCTTGIGSVFISGKILSIGDWVHFGPGCKVFSVNHDIRNVHSCMMAKPIIKESTIIGDNVWVGANAVILSGIHVGKGAVIGAGAVVTKDVPAYSIVVGVPAKVLRNRMIEVTK